MHFTPLGYFFPQAPQLLFSLSGKICILPCSTRTQSGTSFPTYRSSGCCWSCTCPCSRSYRYRISSCSSRSAGCRFSTLSTFHSSTSGHSCRIGACALGACGCSPSCTYRSCRRCTCGSTCHTCHSDCRCYLGSHTIDCSNRGFLNNRWHLLAVLQVLELPLVSQQQVPSGGLVLDDIRNICNLSRLMTIGVHHLSRASLHCKSQRKKRSQQKYAKSNTTTFAVAIVLVVIECLTVTSHARLRARDHCTSSTLMVEKFASHYVWGTNGVCACKMDVKSTWIPKWHRIDHVSWSIALLSNTTSWR